MLEKGGVLSFLTEWLYDREIKNIDSKELIRLIIDGYENKSQSYSLSFEDFIYYDVYWDGYEEEWVEV